MATKKNFYYVGVQTNKGMQLVTETNYSTKTARWDANGKPLAMQKCWAEDLRFGLCMNFHYAVVIQSPFEIDAQYFCLQEVNEQ